MDTVKIDVSQVGKSPSITFEGPFIAFVPDMTAMGNLA
jgi:hypothetical protein